MNPLKPEIREMAALLDSEHEDVEELAGEALRLAYQLYESKKRHGIVFQQDGIFFVIDGFSTENAAATWAKKQGLPEGEAVLVTLKTGDQV